MAGQRTRSTIRHLVIAALAVSVAAAVSGGGAFAQAAKRVSVHDFRPLAEAHLELVKQSRSLVTFEDTYYEYKDGMSITAWKRDSLQHNRFSPLIGIPSRTLVFDYSADEIANTDVLFAKLLSKYHSDFANNEFRLLREGQWLHILPKAGKNANGERIERVSRLDVRVTFPDAERTVAATIQLLTDAVKTASPSNLLFGMGGGNLFTQAKVRTGAQNEIARHVLMRVLESTGQRITWRVLCTFDPSPDRREDILDRTCGLNFDVLR